MGTKTAHNTPTHFISFLLPDPFTLTNHPSTTQYETYLCNTEVFNGGDLQPAKVQLPLLQRVDVGRCGAHSVDGESHGWVELERKQDLHDNKYNTRGLAIGYGQQLTFISLIVCKDAEE